MHGGAAKHVQARARQRLDELVDPALTKLRKLINAKSESVALAAIDSVLDRTGYKLPERLETDNAVTIKVEYEVIEKITTIDANAEPAEVTTIITQALAPSNGSYPNGTTTHTD